MNIINSNQKTTNLNSKMTSKLIYDVKGKIGKVEKSFYEMSDRKLLFHFCLDFHLILSILNILSYLYIKELTKIINFLYKKNKKNI